MAEEYGKRISIDIDVTPVMNTTALNKVINTITGESIDLKVDLKLDEKKLFDATNKAFSKIFESYQTAREKMLSSGQELKKLNIAKMTEDEYKETKPTIQKLIKEMQRGATEMLKARNKIENAFSSAGLSMSKQTLSKMQLPDEFIKVFRNPSKDFKYYSDVGDSIKSALQIFEKGSRGYASNLNFGNLTASIDAIKMKEVKNSISSINKIFSEDMKEYFEMDPAEFKTLEAAQLEPFFDYSNKFFAEYRKLMSKDFSKYLTDEQREDIEDLKNLLNDSYRDVADKLPNSDYNLKEITGRIEDYISQDNDISLETAQVEYETIHNEIDKSIQELDQTRKEILKTQKELDRLKKQAEDIKNNQQQINNQDKEVVDTPKLTKPKSTNHSKAINSINKEVEKRKASSADKIVNDDNSNYTALITNFSVKEDAKAILRKQVLAIDKIKAIVSELELAQGAESEFRDSVLNITDLKTKVSAFDIDEAAKDSLNTAIAGLSDIKAKITGFDVSENVEQVVQNNEKLKIPKSITISGFETTKKAINTLKRKIQDAVKTLEIKTIVPNESALENFKKKLDKVRVEISKVDYSTAAKNFKAKKEKNPLKISATISSFKIGKGAIPKLREKIIERLSNIDIKFKYNLDFIVDEKTKQAVKNQLSGITKEYNDSANKLKNLRENAKSLSERFNSKKSKGKKGGYVATIEDDNIESSLEKIREAIDVLSNPGLNAGEDEIRDYINSVDQIADEFKKVKASAETAFKNIDDFLTAKNAEKVQNSLEKRWNDTYASVQKYLTSNPRIKDNITLYKQYEDILNTFNNIKPSSDVLSKVTKDFSQLKSTVREAGIEGQTFGQKFKGMFEKFGTWGIVTRIMMTAYRIAGRLFTATKDVDTSMVNLRKVSNETEEAYTRFLKNAGKEAKNLGTTITELTEATATFSRLGYGLDDASKLGEVATMYSKVAENLSPEDASNSIISTMKAFRMTAEDAESIIDRFNYVGNNFAISSADIGAALQRSAASLSVAGNSLDESIALITAAQSVAQNAESVGKAYCRQ